MKRSLLLLLLFAGPCLATDPPAAPVIVWPETIPTPPPPQPAPTSYTLNADEWLVVTSNAEMLAWAFPEGLLNIEKVEGPQTLRGKFVGGNGKVQTKTFKAKHILVITAVGTGRATLLVLPSGAKSESEGTVRMVDANLGPLPPPTPPSPPSDPLVAALQAAYLADADPLKAQYLAELAAFYAANAAIWADPRYATTGDIFPVLLAERRKKVPDTALVGVRKIIDPFLMALFGSTSQTLTDQLRKDGQALFLKMSSALREVK